MPLGSNGTEMPKRYLRHRRIVEKLPFLGKHWLNSEKVQQDDPSELHFQIATMLYR